MDRKSIPFTNEHFAAFCEKMLGQPYWFGCCLYKCTESLRSRKAEQYPSHYGTSRTARYRQDIAAKKVCADCIGGIKGYAWTGGGIGVLESIGTDKPISSKYGANGCPDKGANSMFTYAKQKGMDWGTISTLPEIVGLALHKDGHVGIYVGDGYAVEWRGYGDGCIKTKVAGRGWRYWYRLPFINYESAPTSVPDAPTEASVRELSYTSGKTMMRGEDVHALQIDLNALGYACGTADGIFGPKTSSAVKVFQKDHGLEVDGIVGKQTRTALEEAINTSDQQVGDQDPQTQDPSDEHDEGQTPDGAEPGAAVGEEPGSDEGSTDEDDEEAYTLPSDEEPLDYGTRLLRYRSGRTMMTGTDVAAVQKRLIQLGYNPGKPDGIYGPNTVAAVKMLQKAAKIEADGIVGNDTRKMLKDGLVVKPVASANPTVRIKMQRAENIAVYGADEVNLDIEEYLRGVVPSEMYESASAEALKAQAICARTYAYYRRSSVISDTTDHQSFHSGKVGKNPRSDEAIATTKGLVLTYEDKLVNCFYCASNKGETKRSGDVWSTHYPYYVTKTDEWDEAARQESNATSFGHGIGMSQHGAMWAARHGVKCDAILAFYYEGCAIAENYGKI